MASYSAGTITLAAGSYVVTGLGTAFLANVAAGDQLTVVGFRQAFVVTAVRDDATLVVQPAFASRDGNVYSGVPYLTVSRGFTPALSLPSPSKNDLDSSSVLNRAWKIIDRELP